MVFLKAGKKKKEKKNSDACGEPKPMVSPKYITKKVMAVGTAFLLLNYMLIYELWLFKNYAQGDLQKQEKLVTEKALSGKGS